MTKDKTYLGDSVYAEINDDVVMIWTTDGSSIGEEIYLEPHVMAALLKYAHASKIDEAVDFACKQWKYNHEVQQTTIRQACDALRDGGPAKALEILEASLRP